MLPRNFTEEQVMFRDAYRRFLAEEIVPNMEQWREQGIVDRSAFKKAGDRGFLMIWPDEKYGGMGDDDFRYEQVIMGRRLMLEQGIGSRLYTVASLVLISHALGVKNSVSGFYRGV